MKASDSTKACTQDKAQKARIALAIAIVGQIRILAGMVELIIAADRLRDVTTLLSFRIKSAMQPRRITDRPANWMAHPAHPPIRVLATHYSESVTDQVYPGTYSLVMVFRELVQTAEAVLGLTQAQGNALSPLEPAVT